MGARGGARAEAGDESLADRVTDAIRRAIVDGRLPAGSRVTEARLADAHDVSRVPVREALRRLEAEGFVVVSPNRGATVASMSATEARNLLEVRRVLEALVARTAAQRRSEEDVAALRVTLDDGRAALAAGDSERVVELNTRLHTQIVEASGNRVAGDLLRQLRRKIEWLYSRRLSDRGEDSWREHANIIDAIADRDVAGAQALLEAHIHNAQRALELTHPADAVIDAGAQVAPAARAGGHAS